ncbi:MAG TPA: pyridoxal phosphate-dependent aminotransferase [Deltaproteobacteria bacterium]|nr:pyridoxal phosphate-dependent aminotransferase [Deltaproteobacteria bacterium]
MKVADRMESIPFSGIRKVFEEVIRREKAGEKIIHLNIGRPDFDTPKNIKEAAKKALDEGKVHYASNYGITELRDAIAKKTEQENNVVYDPASEIVVTVGANEGVLLAMMGLLNPGDEVLIPDPVWLHYFYCAQMAGAVPISVPTREENEFVPSIEDFKTLLTEKTKMIVLTSPNNPTGAVASAEALDALSRLAKEKDLFVISDEIYESMVYDGNRHISIASLPGMKERTIIVNGFSKKYSMTGWRLGWICSDRALMSAMIRIHQYTTVCVTTFAQYGAAEALTGPQDEINRMITEFDRRRGLVYDSLKEMPGIKVLRPKGAFYIFPNITGTGKTSEEITGYLLDEAKIAVVPGSVFGNYGEGYIRISYANSYENLEIAMSNMNDALRRL